MKQNYLDLFEGIRVEFINKATHDENCDIGATYLGTSRMGNKDELRVEHKKYNGSLFASCSTARQYWLQNTTWYDSKLVILSKAFYLNCLSYILYQRLYQGQNIGNGEGVGVSFIIPIVVNLHEDRCEV